MTSRDVAALADCDEDQLRRLWRAVGFPDVPEGLAVYTDADVEAARRLMHGELAQAYRFLDRAAPGQRDQLVDVASRGGARRVLRRRGS